MITIQNTQFKSDISLVAIMNVMTKAEMLDVCKKLDLYVSPNLKKGAKLPSKKQIRMMTALGHFLDGE